MEKNSQRRSSQGREYEEFVYSGGAAEVLCSAPPRYIPPVPVLQSESSFVTSRVPEPTHAMLTMLFDSIVSEVVKPVLRADTREECIATVVSKWHGFCETLSALHVLIARALSEARAVDIAERASQSAASELLRAARALGGPDAEDEVDFVATTYLNATRIVLAFDGVSEADREQDRMLAQAFRGGAALYQLSALLLQSASESESRSTAASVKVAFELLRAGALQAYAAAREAYDLRVPNDETVEYAEDADISIE